MRGVPTMQVGCIDIEKLEAISLLLKPLPSKHIQFKGNDRNTVKWCDIFTKLTVKTPERRH